MRRRTNVLLATTTAVALVGSGAVAVGATAAEPASSKVATVTATQDAYVDAAYPNRTTGKDKKLVASKAKRNDKLALVQFTVPAVPAGYVLDAAKISLRVNRTTSAKVAVAAASSNWSEKSVTYRTKGALGATVATASLGAQQKGVSLDVTSSLGASGTTVSFAVSVPQGVTSLSAKESGAQVAPKLVVTYKPKPATAKPRPVPVTTSPTPTTTTSPTPTTTTSPAPTTTSPTTTAPATTSRVKIGMSTPASEWDTRLKQVGNIQARRIFGQLGSPSNALKLAKSEVAAGREPILSFKVPNNDWAGVGQGKYDAQLRQLTSDLAALGGHVFVTLHHEPTGDGTPANYAAMMRHALPILGAPASVDAGPIVNGFWWSKGAQGYTDAQIAQWLPADVLKVSEVVASDTYQGGTSAKPGENAGVKIAGMSAWATRVGVKRLGIGEYNGLDAASIKAAGDAILKDPRYAFAAVFNSSVNNRDGVDWTLTGDRLTAFKSTLSTSLALQ
ncbi:MAG TPA: DNRLRE domain-containing protein [Actinomycetales bacterium]|nr:DNRLRE domain-containing protein [Actinomycetales bacterium]